MEWPAVVQYLIAQFSGSFLAGFALELALPDPTSLNKISGTSPQVTDSVTKFQGCLLEFIATFTLVLVVFTGIRLKLNEHHIGMYVGVVLTTFICCIGGYTGASLNPARTLGPYMVAHKFIPLDFVKQPLVVYYISPILGGIAAGFLSKYVLHSDASLHEINNSKGEVDANTEKML
jgi:glycerol uptake facilitator protein